MKNIHILKTDKPTILFIIEGKLYNYHKPQQCDGVDKINVNIYITSDEEIKEGDCHLSFLRDKFEVINYLPNGGYRAECLGKEVCKIILTTDKDLIADGVQAIDDEFLEWFVNNPSCEFVKIKPIKNFNGLEDECEPIYKTIIPKEEPKQETLEEAAERLLNLNELDKFRDFHYIQELQNTFKLGAKWQMDRQDIFAIGFAEWSVARALCCDTFTINEYELSVYKKYIDTLNGN